MKQNLLTRIRIRRRASVYKPHAAAGSGVCLCFELVFAPFLHIIGWLLINQSGALIICLFVYCCGLVFASFLLILPQIQCAKFLPFWSIFRGVLGILVISIKLIRLLLKTSHDGEFVMSNKQDSQDSSCKISALKGEKRQS